MRIWLLPWLMWYTFTCRLPVWCLRWGGLSFAATTAAVQSRNGDVAVVAFGILFFLSPSRRIEGQKASLSLMDWFSGPRERAGSDSNLPVTRDYYSCLSFGNTFECHNLVYSVVAPQCIIRIIRKARASIGTRDANPSFCSRHLNYSSATSLFLPFRNMQIRCHFASSSSPWEVNNLSLPSLNAASFVSIAEVKSPFFVPPAKLKASFFKPHLLFFPLLRFPISPPSDDHSISTIQSTATTVTLYYPTPPRLIEFPPKRQLRLTNFCDQVGRISIDDCIILSCRCFVHSEMSESIDLVFFLRNN